MSKSLCVSPIWGQITKAVSDVARRMEKAVALPATSETRCVSETLEERTFFSASMMPTGRHAHAIARAASQSQTLAPAGRRATGSRRRGGGGVVYGGPITITHGGTYTGNWQSLNADTPAVTVSTDEAVTIINSNIKSAGTLIYVDDAANNVTIKNSNGYGLNPNVAGAYVGRFLDAETFANIDVENCTLQGTAGIYVYNYVGNHTSSQTIKVLHNNCLNVDGRVSNGNNGWEDVAPDPDNYVQFFQSNGDTSGGSAGVSNMVGAEVAWNQVVNQQGLSRVEENINISTTSGGKGHPFLIHDNYINGAFPANSVDEADYTGGGIMVSDNGSSYISAFNNVIVNTGAIGMEISSGHDNAIYNNRIISSGQGPDGSLLSFTNVAAVIWNFNNERTFKRNTGSGNFLGWINSDGARNDEFIPDASAWTGNTSSSSDPTPASEAKEFKNWQKRVAAAGFAVGPI